MKQEVSEAIDELRRAFPSADISAEEDGEGGARFIAEKMDLGEKFVPRYAWLGAHIPALYPYADIYPVFMDAGVRRANGQPFSAPVTEGASFAGRPAIQISRRNNHAQTHPQSAVAKLVKVLDFLENYRD